MSSLSLGRRLCNDAARWYANETERPGGSGRAHTPLSRSLRFTTGARNAAVMSSDGERECSDRVCFFREKGTREEGGRGGVTSAPGAVVRDHNSSDDSARHDLSED